MGLNKGCLGNTMSIINMKTILRNTFCGCMMFFTLVGPVMIASSAKSDDKTCSGVSLGECLDKLQTFLKLKSLPFTSEEAELNKLCNKTVAGYNCSATKHSIPNCLSPGDKDTLTVFVDMAQYAMYMFCAPVKNKEVFGYLREALLKNSECIMKQKDALDCCAEGTKLMDLPVMYVLEQSSNSIKERQISACCPVANFLKCAVPIVEKNCGCDAANLTMEYFRRSSGEPLEAMCQKMPGYPEPDSELCEATLPVCGSTRIGTVFNLMSLICLVFIMKMSYN